MRYRRLGRTGLHISEIGHGLWGMSGWTGSDDQLSTQALQTAADLGCNFFDSAWAYGQGKSDSLLGELLRRNPQKRQPPRIRTPGGHGPLRPPTSLTMCFPRRTC